MLTKHSTENAPLKIFVATFQNRQKFGFTKKLKIYVYLYLDFWSKFEYV